MIVPGVLLWSTYDYVNPWLVLMSVGAARVGNKSCIFAVMIDVRMWSLHQVLILWVVI
jgi:hypothetical protein